MSKAIEDMLNRLSPEARAKVEKDLQEVKRDVPLGTGRDNKTPAAWEAPYNTPSNSKGLEEKQVDPNQQARIESGNRGTGNNYLIQKAIDKSQSSPSQEPKEPEHEPDKER